jgi:hypothetical protein
LIGRILIVVLMIVKLPEHGLSLPKFVLKLPHKLPPDQEIEQEDVEDVHNEDGPVLNILSVKARELNEGPTLTRN